ncbi:YfhJ family protein [Bacillus ndiopicus]|uniref:YfhJ family protein n=1 Tax=Bacillus ndiopicus TaxID=1347368 RepID=UPI0005A5F12B|nr:YfhJ family protein [Bacillus ndiopicus]
MEQHIEKLTEQLLKKNPALSKARARVWVELLWSDFEATSAKAGYAFRGADYTANLVQQLIESYGDKLHEFAGKNPKYAHLLNSSDDIVQ